MIILENTITKELQIFTDENQIGAAFYDWRVLSEEEVAEILLNKKKKEKLNNLKTNRDNYLIKDYISHKAIELYKDEDGDWVDGSEVYFAFSPKSTGNAATEPNSIVFNTILNGQVNPSYYLRYSCRIIDGDVVRKGYVKMTQAIAVQLSIHAANRTTEAIALANEIEAQINDATSIEELESININFTS